MATTPTPGYTGSNVGKIIGGIILLSLIVGWMLFGGCEGHQSKPTSVVQSGKIITVPVFTDRWTGVPTGGRKFDGHWIIHNGVTLTYLICANTTNVSFEIPSKDGVVLLGPPSDISKLYFMLKPGQGYDKATLQLDLH